MGNAQFTIPERVDLGTPEARAVNHLERASVALLAALGAADGPDQQPNTVRIGVGDALFQLDAAIKELEAAPGKRKSRPVKFASAALKQTFKANDKLLASRPAPTTVKPLHEAYIKLTKALDSLE